MEKSITVSRNFLLYKKITQTTKTNQKISKATDNKLPYFKISSLNHKMEKKLKNMLTKASQVFNY